MAAKQLQLDEAAHHALLRGVEKLARAVKGTLGPSGRNVILDKKTVVQPSRKTALPWRRKSSSRTRTKTWELNWSARSLPRPPMSPVMAQRPQPFWAKQSSAKASRT